MSDNLAHQLGGSGVADAQNAAENLAKGDIREAAKDVAKAGTKFGSQKTLTVFWGSVWLDWTLLSLLYLNGHLFASFLLPKYVCQFGEDYLIGKWIPSKELAKWTEIIILAVIDAIVITIIVAIVYFVYKLVTCSWWDLSSVVLPGGQGIEACFE